MLAETRGTMNEPNSQEQNPVPIQRVIELQPLSREHHHALMFCWKVKQGLKQRVATERIRQYRDWIWTNEIQQHFKIEEQYVFTVLGASHPLVIQATQEHTQLQQLFEDKANLLQSLEQLHQLLHKHVRFEERILFNQIQNTATHQQLEIIAQTHNVDVCDNWPDKFWVV